MTDLNQRKKQTIYNTVSLEHTVLSLSLFYAASFSQSPSCAAAMPLYTLCEGMAAVR